MAKKPTKPKMSPAQAKKIREELGLTQTQLASALWMSEAPGGRVVRAYEAGERGISGPVQLCLHYIRKFGILPRP